MGSAPVSPIGASPVAWGEGVDRASILPGKRCIPSRLGRGRPRSWSCWRGTVHPQSPGERLHAAVHADGALGASPVAWGEVLARSSQRAVGRCIPSRLGRGPRPPGARRSRPVHPQSPGERCSLRCSPALAGGASPVAWGEAHRDRRHAARRRCIPSRLGRGPPPCRRGWRPAVHPQSPGEREERHWFLGKVSGASPVAWGEDERPLHPLGEARCIPSRLGRGCRPSGARRRRAVHPQSPGERMFYRFHGDATNGASPVAWGEVPLPVLRRPYRRCIPSRLGRGPRERGGPRGLAVHPQSPGERPPTAFWAPACFGASPVAWGEGRRRPPVERRRRCIPSRLGRGTRPRTRSRPSPVHPQSPGERSGSGPVVRATCGASPVAWGEAHQRALDARGLRCIPSRLGRGSGSAGSCPTPSVHPQSPGERRRAWRSMRRASGASPVAWGEVKVTMGMSGECRCIPSRLGRGTSTWTPPPPSTVHPQSPGERSVNPRSIPTAAGASPVAWGEVHGPLNRAHVGRCIPSRLGRGSPARTRSPVGTVHPQSPGERPG